MLTYDKADQTWAIRATFKIEDEGEDRFVVEKIKGQSGFTRFGPMPRDFVGPFIDERKEFYANVVRRFTRW